jgi:hypothetical protein
MKGLLVCVGSAYLRGGARVRATLVYGGVGVVPAVLPETR